MRNRKNIKTTVIIGSRGTGKTLQTKKVLILDTNDDLDLKPVVPLLKMENINPFDYEEEVNENGVPVVKPVLKSVYCNYRGYLIVYDVDGKKVHELSGEMTYEKYEEIEKRSRDGITEFDGLEDYRCIACELKKKAFDKANDNLFDPFAKPVKGTPYTSTQATVSVSSVPPLASPPFQPIVGERYFDTTRQEIGIWDGSNWYYFNHWAPSSGVPPQTPPDPDDNGDSYAKHKKMIDDYFFKKTK